MQTILNWISVEEKLPEKHESIFILERFRDTKDLIFNVGYLSEGGIWTSKLYTDNEGYDTYIENPLWWCEEPKFENKKYFIKCPECKGTGYWHGVLPTGPDDDMPVCSFCKNGKMELDLSEVVCE